MTNEERDLIAKFVARIGGAQQGGFTGSGVPATQPALPPIDPEADAFIKQQFGQHGAAAYRMTQTALVQEAALAEAQNRIQRLEWELDQARSAPQQQQSQQQNKGFFGGLFGGGQPQQAPMQRQGPWQGQPQGSYGAPPPQPQHAPSYQPGMFQRGGGSGFLGSALTTAAGVAGGMVVGNALMNAFSGHGGGVGQSASAASSPWATNASDPFSGGGTVPTDPAAGYDTGASDPFAGGGAEKHFGGYDTNTGWDQAGLDQGGDMGGFDGGGYDDNS